MSYYQKFVATFPDVKTLAAAKQDAVLKLWQGLGYYSRARNLHHTAGLVMKNHKGIFPKTYNELIALKGIGTYTAAAISSFADNEARAVVDGNVYRVLSRVFGIVSPIDSVPGKKEFALLAEQLLSKKDPATHNQSVMEFGALQCKPKNPDCHSCPMQNNCFAFAKNKVEQFPVKEKKIKVSTRHFEYFVFRYKNSVYIKKRAAKDIWENLYDFPLLESPKTLGASKVLNHVTFNSYVRGSKYLIGPVSGIYKHVLSHQHIYARFWQIEIEKELKPQKDWKKISLDTIDKYAWPRLIDKYLASFIRV
jgi:A/G-specific adenine glycosylase